LNLKKILKLLKENGRTVIISSHIPDFVKSIYDMSIFIKDGKILKCVSKNEDLEKIYIEYYIKKDLMN